MMPGSRAAQPFQQTRDVPDLRAGWPFAWATRALSSRRAWRPGRSREVVRRGAAEAFGDAVCIGDGELVDAAEVCSAAGKRSGDVAVEVADRLAGGRPGCSATRRCPGGARPGRSPRRPVAATSSRLRYRRPRSMTKSRFVCVDGVGNGNPRRSHRYVRENLRSRSWTVHVPDQPTGKAAAVSAMSSRSSGLPSSCTVNQPSTTYTISPWSAKSKCAVPGSHSHVPVATPSGAAR